MRWTSPRTAGNVTALQTFIRRASDSADQRQRRAFAQALVVLAEVFETPVSSARAEAYYLALVELDADALRAACTRALRECTFFPRPAELLALAGTDGPAASEAYATLLAALRTPAAYHRRPLLSLALNAVVDQLGGWRAVALMPEHERWPRFARAYAPAASRRGPVAARLDWETPTGSLPHDGTGRLWRAAGASGPGPSVRRTGDPRE